MYKRQEHKLIEKYKDRITNLEEVEEYKKKAALKSDFERAELNKEKTGVEIKGIKAINPLTNEEIPIWISDYVLITYGTGAIMAVPAHDTRDFEFAKKFNLPIKPVIIEKPKDYDNNKESLELLEKEIDAKFSYCFGDDEKQNMSEAFTDVNNGIAVNSGFLDGLESKDAINKAIEYIEEHKLGERKVNYKLRDWVFSRQRYWGEPIPMVYCEKCGWVPIPEEELPLKLPDVEDYEPGENGESPLAKHEEWINTTCPHCGGKARRETDTMPQWAGSSWYYLRYMDPHNDKALASKEALEYWSPVDWYNGGMEHTTLHLLYSRFWHKFLYDIGVVPTKEPYAKRTSHGMILGSNGEKMSKSKGNVINPDEIVDEFGADAFRVYEMFMGPFDQTAPWSMESIRGCMKFLDRVWNMQDFLVDGDESLCLGYEDVKIYQDVYVGDMMEYKATLTHIGNTSRDCRIEVFKLATPAYRAGKEDYKPGDMVWFDEPVLCTEGNVRLVVKKHLQRGEQPDGAVIDPWRHLDDFPEDE